jgi:hypothetical protein
MPIWDFVVYVNMPNQIISAGKISERDKQDPGGENS